jgi:acetolactate synthase-1/2/3 large subunit
MQQELVNTRQKSGTYGTRRIDVNDITRTAKTTEHPLAGTNMSGADIVVQVLADEGVDTIFGYSGGAILPTYDAVFRYNDKHRTESGDAPIPLVVPANEQGAGFMASGYARASGKVGVVMVTSGPGATNTVTPVRDCMADSVPIVVICGQVPTAAIGTDAFQEAPVSAIMGAVAKHIFLVTEAEKLEATVRSAFELARTGRPGPVVIDIPKDIQNWVGEYKGQGYLPLAGYHRRLDSVRGNHLEDAACERFYKMLAQAERPLIYAGGGVINGNATKPMRRFANEYGIPVTTTLMALGASNTRHPLAMHMLGMHGLASANYAVEDCDFLITVGARFDDRVAGDGKIRKECEEYRPVRYRYRRDRQGQTGQLASCRCIGPGPGRTTRLR